MRHDDPQPAQMRPCHCVEVSPFRVSVDGTEMDALRIDGQTWQVGQTGTAFWRPPAMPVCVKTTR